MKITYLITCKNETDTLQKLLDFLLPYLKDSSEYEGIEHFEINDDIVMLDDYSDNLKTIEILNSLKTNSSVEIHQSKLNNNYGEHKNTGIELCSGDFIFQLDGDERPSENIVGKALHILINQNPSVEAFAIPRINDFKGVNQEHANRWGWNINTIYEGRPIVNWPDYQFRIFKREPKRIFYKRRLHEKIEGYDKYIAIPPDFSYALYHDKDIEKQIKTNLGYNSNFTEKENRGHNVFGKEANLYQIESVKMPWVIKEHGPLPKEGEEKMLYVSSKYGEQRIPMLLTSDGKVPDIPRYEEKLIPKYFVVYKIIPNFKIEDGYTVIFKPSE